MRKTVAMLLILSFGILLCGCQTSGATTWREEYVHAYDLWNDHIIDWQYWRYYGNYSGYDILLKPYMGVWAEADMDIPAFSEQNLFHPVSIGDGIFSTDRFTLLAYKDGVFTSLKDLKEEGLIGQTQYEEIARTHNLGHQVYLSASRKTAIASAYEALKTAKWPWYDKNKKRENTVLYYGTYGEVLVFRVFLGPAEKGCEVNIGREVFVSSEDFALIGYQLGEQFTWDLKQYFERGMITATQLVQISLVHQNYEAGLAEPPKLDEETKIYIDETMELTNGRVRWYSEDNTLYRRWGARDYGEYSGYRIIFQPEPMGRDEYSFTIGAEKFVCSNFAMLYGYADGEFHEVPKLFAEGVFTESQIAQIAETHREFEVRIQFLNN